MVGYLSFCGGDHAKRQRASPWILENHPCNERFELAYIAWILSMHKILVQLLGSRRNSVFWEMLPKKEIDQG
jgi:hypothetical protein